MGLPPMLGFVKISDGCSLTINLDKAAKQYPGTGFPGTARSLAWMITPGLVAYALFGSIAVASGLIESPPPV